MSTPGTPQPGTPTPAAPPQSAAEIAAANAESQSTPTPGQPPAVIEPPAAAAPTVPTPENPVITSDIGGGKFKVSYLTGETFEGTAAEIMAKQGAAHINTKLWAQKNQTPPTPAAPTPPPSKFADDAEAQAAKYASTLVAKEFGFDSVEEMKQAMGKTMGTSSEFEAQNISLQFQAAAPDFNQTPENSQKLLAAIGQTISDDVFESMARPQQINMMRQAHAYLIQLGPQGGGYAPKPAAAPPARPAPIPGPPVGGGRPQEGGVLPAELVPNINDTAVQIREKFEKAKALGYQV